MSISSLFKALTTLILALSFTSQASVITNLSLDDIPSNYRYQNLPSFNEGGFNISVNQTNKVNVFSQNLLNWGADGKFLETWNTQAIFTITEITGRLFDFIGMDIGWYNNDVLSANWDVRAYDQAGQLINAQSVSDSGYVGVGFQGVHSIQIQQSSVGASSFDNLKVKIFEPLPQPLQLTSSLQSPQPASSVSAPGTASLFVLMSVLLVMRKLRG